MLARQKMEHTIPFLMPIDETFDIGLDTRTPVDDSYEVPFRFTGKIDRVTFNVKPEQLGENDRKIIQHALAKANN